MASVLQLTKTLTGRAVPKTAPQVRVRTYGGPADTLLWLELRSRAFARQKLGVRQWSEADFTAEFLAKSWWRPDWMWFAEFCPANGSPPHNIGTVTLAIRGHLPSPVAAELDTQPEAVFSDPSLTKTPVGKGVVHWLAVLPRERRHGVGRTLMETLEAAAWDAGFRQVSLETHAAWSEAVEFYRAVGYVAEVKSGE